MNYTTKKKLEANLLTILTFIVVVFNLFPILWMFYVSFMDNNDVMSGKVKMSRRRNDAVKIFNKDNSVLYCTKDGAISKFSMDNLKLQKSININSFATSYTNVGDDIYMFSVDKGLYKLSMKTFKYEKLFAFDDILQEYSSKYKRDYKKIYVNDVVSTSLESVEGKLYLGVWHKDAPGLIVYDISKAKLDFITRSELGSKIVKYISKDDNGELAVLTDKGITLVDGKTASVKVKLTTFDRADLLKFAKIDDNYFAAINITAQKVFIYKREGDYLKPYKIIGKSYGLVNTSIASLISLTQDSSLVLGLNTSAKVLKIPMKRIVLEDSTSIKEPALEIPIEKNQYGYSFDSTKVVSISAVYGKTDSTIVGGDIIVYDELKNSKAIIGGNFGKLSLLDWKSQKLIETTLAPKGKIFVHWRNYIDVFRNIDFGLYLKNSLIICTTVMVIAMFLASLAGYSLSRYNFPGKDLFGYTVLATQMVPGIMFLIPIYLMFVKFNELTGIAVKGSYWGVIFTYSAFFVPFSIWILRGFFAAIPKALEEAALIDGCTPFQAFIKIIIPSAMPGIVATGIYVFLLAWDELMFAWILTNEKTYTIPVGIRNFAGNYQNRYDLMMAAATIATIPVMILFFMMQKQIVSGLTAGAVKE